MEFKLAMACNESLEPGKMDVARDTINAQIKMLDQLEPAIQADSLNQALWKACQKVVSGIKLE